MLCALSSAVGLRSDTLNACCRGLCAEIAPASQHLIDAFGIPPHLQAAPIAADWEEYNRVDNQGELIGPAFD